MPPKKPKDNTTEILKLFKDSQKSTSTFMSFFSIFCLVGVFAYIFLITFVQIPKENARHADTILGFLAGTLLSTILNYYYGSSKSSKEKDAILERLTQFKELVNTEIDTISGTTSAIAETVTPTPGADPTITPEGTPPDNELG